MSVDQPNPPEDAQSSQDPPDVPKPPHDSAPLPPNAPPVVPTPAPDAPITEPLAHTPISARVPESVSRGVFATGVIVQEGQGEFVLDFVQSLTRPPQIAARVVMTPSVLRSLVASLAENIARYTTSFGPPPAMPRPAPGSTRRQTTQELYEHFKLPESLWSGVYSNAVLIGHNPAEFFLDFITRFYPHAAVSCRVYLSAAQAPRVQETLSASLQQYQNKHTPPPSSGADPTSP